MSALFSIGNYDVKLTEKQQLGLKLLCNKKKKYYKFYGGARSGKTFLSCLYILHRALIYNDSVHLIARYSKQSAKNTVWRQEMLPLLREAEKANWCKINYTECYATFYNGSFIQIGGLRPSDITSILSSEYQTIFICEANENSFDIVEHTMTRLTGLKKNKDNKLIDLKFIIDLNPTLFSSWTYKVWEQGINQEGKSIDNYERYVKLHFIPEDNIENISSDYIEDLRSLSENKQKRFLFGEYGSFEGLVYSGFDENNIIDDFEITKDWIFCLGIDFGYTHPFVCIEAVLSSDDCLYITKEYYKTRRTVKQHSEIIKKHFTTTEENINKKYSFVVCDTDAEDQATLKENQIYKIVSAYKKVNAGIERVQDFILRDKLKVFRSCRETINEFVSYRWKDKADIKDREVLKKDDHCMDTIRYIMMNFFPIKEKIKIGRIGYY